MKTLKQELSLIEQSVKPFRAPAIDMAFFNGEKITMSDGIEYPGYFPVTSGSFSDNPEDENYISPEKFDALVLDAMQDINAYTNGAIRILGVFNEFPNFTSIPVVTKYDLMQAVAAKVEQSVYTKPTNAEIKVTFTQNSGGRTTNVPGRELFEQIETLNMKVQSLINGSKIFELLEDSFEAIGLDRNDYYTKEEVDALLGGNFPVERLFTEDVENWVPTEDGDGVNKKYVDAGDAELQGQINALIVGDVELKTNHVAPANQALESYVGLANHQSDINIENNIVLKQHKNRIDNLDKRTGVPLQAYKTLGQSVSSITYTDIVDYDAVGNGTADALNGFNSETGVYTITQESSGDNVSIEATFKATGKPLPGQIVGYATIQKNGETVNHPVTGNAIEIPLFILTTAGGVFTVAIKDVNIRREVEDQTEFNVGDELKLVVKQTAAGLGSGFPLTISEVQFDFINNRVLAETGESSGGATSTVIVNDIAAESISGTAETQQDVNIENKVKVNETDVRLDTLETTVGDIDLTEYVPVRVESGDETIGNFSGAEIEMRETSGIHLTSLSNWDGSTPNVNPRVEIKFDSNNIPSMAVIAGGNVPANSGEFNLYGGNKANIVNVWYLENVVSPLMEDIKTLKAEIKALKEVNNEN